MIAIIIANLKYTNIFPIFSQPGSRFNLTYAVSKKNEKASSKNYFTKGNIQK